MWTENESEKVTCRRRKNSFNEMVSKTIRFKFEKKIREFEVSKKKKKGVQGRKISWVQRGSNTLQKTEPKNLVKTYSRSQKEVKNPEWTRVNNSDPQISLPSLNLPEAEDVEWRPKIGRRGQPLQDRESLPGAKDVESRPWPVGAI